jgi:type III pantothenate kinase
MLLAIDIGNTNIHLGLWRDGRWAVSWRARTVPDKMPDEYAVLVRNFLSTAEVGFEAIDAVIISSVVPALTLAFRELVNRYTSIDPMIVTHETHTGIRVDIDQPEQAGADRIVNSVAAHALYGGPAIVVDFGTATTFDVVSEDGAYLGGAIAPGVGVAHDALVSRAARLHKVDFQPPPNPIGKNTIHALQSGIFLGYLSLIEGMIVRLKAAMDMGEKEINVIATGGLSILFKPYTDMIDVIAPDLLLDGLRIIYERNQV